MLKLLEKTAHGGANLKFPRWNLRGRLEWMNCCMTLKLGNCGGFPLS